MPEINQARPAPASLQRPEALMVEHGIELVAQGGVDVGDVAVECRTQPVSTRRQQAGNGLAEPRFQRFTEAQLAVEEGRKLAGDVVVLLAEELASQHLLAQRPTLLRRLRRGGCNRCFLAHGVPVPPMMAAGARSRGSGGQAFWGMLATMRKLVVSSSICSQGRR